MQQLEECKARVVAGGARDLEGCKSLKRLKPGNGKLECLNNRGL